jgi:hypothetical protein
MMILAKKDQTII